MTAEWVTALGTIVTAVVIAASAGAALMQLRHMRKSNEIDIVERWSEVVASDRFQHARWFVAHDVPALLADPERVRALQWDPFPPELAPVRIICNHFEVVGSFVRFGSVDAFVTCELWAVIVLECWRAIAPITALMRRRYQANGIWENFEYLAVLSEDYLAKHASENYPRSVRRMPVDRSLIEMLVGTGASEPLHRETGVATR